MYISYCMFIEGINGIKSLGPISIEFPNVCIMSGSPRRETKQTEPCCNIHTTMRSL